MCNKFDFDRNRRTPIEEAEGERDGFQLRSGELSDATTCSRIIDIYGQFMREMAHTHTHPYAYLNYKMLITAV